MFDLLKYPAIILISVLFTAFFFKPIFSILSLLFIRASIGPLRDLEIYAFGLDLNVLGLFSLFACLLAVCYALVKRLRCKNAFFIWYSLFCIWSLISISYSIDKKISIADFLRVFSPIMFYLLIWNEIKGKANVDLMIKIIILSSIIPITYGLYQSAADIGKIRSGVLRIYSTFILPNPFGFYLCLISLISTGYMFIANKRSEVLLSFCILCLSTFTLFLTGTRTAIVGFLVGLLCYTILSKKRKVLLPTVVIVAIALALHPDIRKRVLEPSKSILTALGQDRSHKLIYMPPKPKERWEMNTWEWRVSYWKELMDVYSKRPFLGYGIGNSIPAIVSETTRNRALIPHNDYLRLLLEVGIIGFLLYMLSFCILITTIFKYFMRSKDLLFRHYYSCGIALTVSFLTIMLADNIILSNTFLWYFFAIIAAAYNVRDEEAKEAIDV